jgi:hypothetical protein
VKSKLIQSQVKPWFFSTNRPLCFAQNWKLKKGKIEAKRKVFSYPNIFGKVAII